MKTSYSHSFMMEQAREDARKARKQRYLNVIGVATGAAGIAMAMAGLPFGTAFIWGFGAVAWFIIQRA